MRPFISVVLGTLLLNSLLYVVYVMWLSDSLEDYKFRQLNQDLEYQLQQAREVFSNKTEAQWQPTAYSLQSRTDTGVNVYRLDSKEVSDDTRTLLADPVNAKGVIDPYMPYVYLPLGQSHVLEIGPIMLNNWQGFLGELILIYGATLVNVLGLLWLYRWQSERLLRAKKAVQASSYFTGQPSPNSIDGLQRDLKNLLHQFEQLDQQHQQRIINQQDLLHGVAHEFRSPMARIQFALDMLADADQQQSTELRQQIESNLNELNTLVKELLSYSRLKSKNTHLDLQQVDVEEVVQQCINDLQPIYPEIQFSYQQNAPLLIDADDWLLKRALINVMRNAARYAVKNVELVALAQPNQRKLTINDDGPGIPPGKRERIFEPFTRLDSSRSRDSGGSGLGLAITKAILDKHGATISVDNNDLGGASMQISFNQQVS